ncbi:MAG TPA: hypothetical protein DIS90_04515 [Cytophagales bacterium]|nr:hypothetical protein [Cytophagales bacterium]
MAKPSLKIIQVLRNTAKKLEQSASYQWGHMGACNCGFLAQEVTALTQREIHSRAMERYGDWNEQLNDYCPTSGLLMDDLISELLQFGFDVDDLKHLEKLSDPKVLQKMADHRPYPKHNNKADVVAYLRAMASMLEGELLAEVQLPNYTKDVYIQAPVIVSI